MFIYKQHTKTDFKTFYNIHTGPENHKLEFVPYFHNFTHTHTKNNYQVNRIKSKCVSYMIATMRKGCYLHFLRIVRFWQILKEQSLNSSNLNFDACIPSLYNSIFLAFIIYPHATAMEENFVHFSMKGIISK